MFLWSVHTTCCGSWIMTGWTQILILATTSRTSEFSAPSFYITRSNWASWTFRLILFFLHIELFSRVNLTVKRKMQICSKAVSVYRISQIFLYTSNRLQNVSVVSNTFYYYNLWSSQSGLHHFSHCSVSWSFQRFLTGFWPVWLWQSRCSSLRPFSLQGMSVWVCCWPV